MVRLVFFWLVFTDQNTKCLDNSEYNIAENSFGVSSCVPSRGTVDPVE